MNFGLSLNIQQSANWHWKKDSAHSSCVLFSQAL